MIDNMKCPLGKNNFLEVKFFVPTVEICGDHCKVNMNYRITSNFKIVFTHKDQSGRLNFELSYNERTLIMIFNYF